MHEPYDEDDGYPDDDYDKDYHSDTNKWYYKFDIGPDTPISGWLSDMINQWFGNNNSFNSQGDTWDFINISGFPLKKFPVNSWNPNTGKGNSFQYLGSNYQGSPIWKKKYFIIDKMNNEYRLHLQSHAGHFVYQPTYYKGLFDIMN